MEKENNSYYGMPIKKHWLTGELYHSTEDFDKAKCPICKKLMTYEHSIYVIRFACENIKCKGYMLWLSRHSKTMNGNINLN